MQRIQQACLNAGGSIPFSKYMNMALYEPGLGYYSGGSQKFGAKGDFITSPEVSPLFGQCLANQIAESLRYYKNKTKSKGSAAYILEFGAGSGVLAVDVLLRLESLASLPEKYLILELSAELKQRQRETITKKAPHLLDYVQWLDQLPENVDDAVVIANEVLDAMPVECFKISGSSDHDNTCCKVEALMVATKDGSLSYDYEVAEDSLQKKINSIQQRSATEFPAGYCSEHNLLTEAWLASLADAIENLVVLLIDYGYNEKEYYHSDRDKGTLMCYYQHRAHDDFFWWPGLQDITAFVNFTDVAYCAVDSGLDVSGYSTQAAFLLASGLSELHESQVTDDVQQQIKLSQQIKTLTLPSEMGERFKVMALTKNYDESLTGFSLQDLRNRL